jgi:hypothetical protein
MTIGISKKAANFTTPICRGCQKLRSPRFQHGVCRLAIWNANCHCVANFHWILRTGKSHVGLIFSRPTACHQQKPTAEERQNARSPTILSEDLGTQYTRIKALRAFYFADHQNMGQLHTFTWKIHLQLPLCFSAQRSHYTEIFLENVDQRWQTIKRVVAYETTNAGKPLIGSEVSRFINAHCTKPKQQKNLYSFCPAVKSTVNANYI